MVGMNYAAMMHQAVEAASAVMEELFKSFDAEPPSRDELRARFEEVMNATDDETYTALRQGFESDFPERFDREWALKMQRTQGD